MKNEHLKSGIIAAVFVLVVVIILFLIDRLNIKSPAFLGLIFIAFLVALGVPAWIDKHYFYRIQDEKAKIKKDVENIKISNKKSIK